MASRRELFAKLGVHKPIVAPILSACHEREEEQIWREDLFNAPHGEPWHTSFHASNFPGDNPKACARQAMYTMMNVPAMKPFDYHVRLMGEVGKAIEVSTVERFHRAGILLSNPPDEEYQTGYTDEEHWLTCAPDAIIELPNKNRPHVVEVKGKDPKVVEAMREGRRSFDPAHRSQVLTQIGLTHENSLDLWPDMEKCEDGTILYQDRARPGTVHEFKFQYNEKFMEQGRAALKEWQGYFLDGELPPRPKEWRWTEPPCQYCPVKKLCKADYKDKVTKLEDSNAIKHTEEVRGEYDYNETRQAVLDRWGVS